MMVSGFKCDQCQKTHNNDVGILPYDWFALTKGNGRLLGVEKHFCCIECLALWVPNPANEDETLTTIKTDEQYWGDK